MPDDKTTVVNMKRDNYDVYIGRPSIWGNPFRVGIDGTREEVIEKYRKYIKDKPHLIELAHRVLKGKILGCHCKPQQCHGEVWCEILNCDSKNEV